MTGLPAVSVVWVDKCTACADLIGVLFLFFTPRRWEVNLDAVFVDGQKLPNSKIPANGLSNTGVSALIDTVNIFPSRNKYLFLINPLHLLLG